MRTFQAIAAISENRVIGAAGKIPWHVPDDFRWFKQTTTGGILVMGRKTFESIGKPLPGRETIIISRTGYSYPGTRTAHSVAELDKLTLGDPRQVWICGGAEIYRLFLPYCGEIVLSRIHRTVEGDAFFPEIDDAFDLAGELHRTPEFHVERYRRRAGVKSSDSI